MRRSILLSLVSAAVVLAVAPARAQGPVARRERPNRALFGNALGPTEQLLQVDFMTGIGYDNNLSAEASGSDSSQVGTLGPRASGSFGSLSGSLGYSLGRERYSLNATASLQGRYYPQQTREFLASYGGGVGGEYRPSDKTTLSFNHSATYQPYYSQAFFLPVYDAAPGSVTMPLPTISEQREEYLSSTSGLQFSQGLSRRVSLTGSYAYQATGGSGIDDFSSQIGSASLSYTIAQGLALRMGYTLQEAEYERDGPTQRARNSSIDGGVDFNRALSLTRRTHLQFNTGMAITADGADNHYTLIGGATLTREIGRTWNAGLTFARDVNLSPFYEAPVLSDSLSFFYGGLVNRKMQWSTFAGVSSGTVGFAVGDNSLLSFTAGTSAQFGFTRNLGLMINYAYYRHEYGADILLPPGALRTFNRQSVSAQVTVWAPLMQRRRANASR